MTEVRLYLDFDGVLHGLEPYTTETEARRDGHLRRCRDGHDIYFHPRFFEHAPALASLLADFPEVRVYVHSTWRHLWREDRPEDIADFLGEALAARYVRNVPGNVFGRRYDVVKTDMATDGFTGPWVAVEDERVAAQARGRVREGPMTVGELIALLSDLPQDLPVMVDGYEDGAHDLTPDNVKQVDAVLYYNHDNEDVAHYYGPHAYRNFLHDSDPDDPVKAVILARPK